MDGAYWRTGRPCLEADAAAASWEVARPSAALGLAAGDRPYLEVDVAHPSWGLARPSVAGRLVAGGRPYEDLARQASARPCEAQACPVGDRRGPSERPVGDRRGPSERPVGDRRGPSERPVGDRRGPSERPVGDRRGLLPASALQVVGPYREGRQASAH